MRAGLLQADPWIVGGLVLLLALAALAFVLQRARRGARRDDQ
jgi:hypothetical protein